MSGWLRWAVLLVGGTAAVALALVLLWDWNWFKPMLERQASSALRRAVTIDNLRGHIGRNSWLAADGLTLANREGFGPEPMARIELVHVTIELQPLLQQRLVLPLVRIVRPFATLVKDGERGSNYVFDLPPGDGGGSYDLAVGAIEIEDGVVTFVDQPSGSEVQLSVVTEPGPSGEAQLVLQGGGQWRNGEAQVSVRGGSILSARDPDQPYPLEGEVRMGDTLARIQGTIANPLQFAGAQLDLSVEGRTMSDLFPLIGFPTPPTPPYAVRGQLELTAGVVGFRNFTGRMGRSDLGGVLEVDTNGERPFVRGELASRLLHIGDVAGFIGLDAAQRRAVAGDTLPGAPDMGGRVLPSMEIDREQLRSIDADIRYRASRLQAPFAPLDNLTAHLTMQAGRLALQPLQFGVGKGRIAIELGLDGRPDPAAVSATIDFRNLELARIMRETRLFEGAGVVGGKARLRGRGDSTAAILGGADGNLQLFLAGGHISKLLVELVGVDATEALGFAATGDEPTPLRCMIVDLSLKNGLLATNAFVIDTEDTNVEVTGTVNLRDESLDLRLRPHPKDISILTARTPVDIGGTLAAPTIAPDATALAARAGAAIALGVLLTPLAALLPTIELGLGKDSDCDAMIRDAQAKAAAPGPRLDERSGGGVAPRASGGRGRPARPDSQGRSTPPER